MSRDAAAHEGVLVVEDDEDLAEAMSVLLTSEQYEVTVARDAEAGLAQLRAGGYFVVLSDYSMPPGPTGAWMLAEAQREGLLHDVHALVVTASRQPDGLEGFHVLHKPVDVYLLLAEIRKALIDWRQRRHAEDASAGAAALAKSPDVRIELILYVSQASSASTRALSNIDHVLKGFDRRAVSLKVLDAASEEADKHAIGFTPTLVREFPKPRHWLIGDLSNRSLLERLLEDAGVPRKVTHEGA